MKVFVSGTGTGVGKTVFSCALARAVRASGETVTAIKPFETGCDPTPEDAVALARACDRPELATWPGLYRAREPLAPAAVVPPPDLDSVLGATRAAMSCADHAIVEGAGGILVPLDASRSIADVSVALELPLVLVGRDGLGVLSAMLTAVEAAERRGLDVAQIVLAQHGPPDPSRRRNLELLAARVPSPVHAFADDATEIWMELSRRPAGP